MALKIAKDFMIVAEFLVRIVSRFVSGFKYSLLLMLIVFTLRAVVAGNLIPQAITNIVNSVVKLGDGFSLSFDETRFMIGIVVFLVSGITYVLTEFVLMKYFKDIARAIVVLKEEMLKHVRFNGTSDQPDDALGKISNDVDFVMWNINVVLTTLIPNLFTAIVASMTLFSYNRFIGWVSLAFLVPYVLLAEYYSVKVEPARLRERENYSVSIARIRDVLYGEPDNGVLSKVLSAWRNSITAIMLYDRVYWGLGLASVYVSTGVVTFFSVGQARSGELDVGSLAGVISATLNAHNALLNAMWALCMQGQTTAVVKRIMKYFIEYHPVNTSTHSA